MDCPVSRDKSFIKYIFFISTLYMESYKLYYKPRFCISKICLKGRLIKSLRDLILLVGVIPNFACTILCTGLPSHPDVYCKIWDKSYHYYITLQLESNISL